MTARVHAADRVPLGRTALPVSPVTVGTSGWGADTDAAATARAAFAAALNVLDTSNEYAGGHSERHIGEVLATGGAPADLVVATKLDRDPETGSFSAERMRRSWDESRERLGLDSVPLLYLHDPEYIGFDAAMQPGGPVEALVALRDEGVAASIGISGGPAAMLQRFVETGIFDAVITHNRFTLVDRTADALLTAATERGLGVVNAAVYGGGVLSRWPRTSDRYHYRPATPGMLGAIDAMGAACERRGVALGAAALQFSVRDPRVHTTVCGIRTPAHVDRTREWLGADIPDDLWPELDALVPDRSEWAND